MPGGVNMKKLSKKEWRRFLATLEVDRKTGQLPFWKNFLASFDNENEPYEVIYPDMSIYLAFLHDAYQDYWRRGKYVIRNTEFFEDYMNRVYPVEIEIPVEVVKK